MRKRNIFLLAFLTFILFLPSFVLSHYKVVNESRDIYFGHISYSEIKYDGKDPKVFREGEKFAEIAVLNLPLAPGDTIWTTDSRRCEIQFDNGTIIRLDLNTELKIETILAQSLSSRKKMSNLLLRQGGIYVMYKEYNFNEMFQVITPNTAVKMKNNAVAMIRIQNDGSTDVQVKYGKAYALFGPDEDHLEEKKINKLERLTISKDNKSQLGAYLDNTDFELWNNSINENFEELHEGKSAIPEPILRYPKAIVYFAQKYSNRYGEWVWDNLYGYVWVPYFNQYFPWGNWDPYFYGNWREINGQLFWVPGEPWGWVPYHLGLWTWDKNRGWMWLPGSLFAPAWVTWDFFMGFYCWRPWSFLDWYFYPMYDSYAYNRYYYNWYSNVPGESIFTTPDKVLNVIRKDQLKKRESYPLPKEMKKVYEGVISGLKKGDEKIVSSFQNIPNQLVMVKKEDLNNQKLPDKILRFEQISKQIEKDSLQKESLAQGVAQDPAQEAVKDFRRNKEVAEVREHVISTLSRRNENIGSREKITLFEKRTGLSEGGPESSLRFRDWNPDLQTARRMGVEIIYSSRSNEIRCPQLGLSSIDVSVSRASLSSRGEFSPSSSRISSESLSSSGGAGAAPQGRIHSEGNSGGSSAGTVKKKNNSD